MNREIIEKVEDALMSRSQGHLYEEGQIRDMAQAAYEAALQALLDGGWVNLGQPIDAAPKDIENLASSTGKVWFQCCWDDEDGWVTFNRYMESDPQMKGRKWVPTVWIPLPTAVISTSLQGQEDQGVASRDQSPSTTRAPLASELADPQSGGAEQ